MTDRLTIDAYDAQIDAYAELTSRDKPDPVLLAFIERIPSGGYVLDLGCGPANAAAEMRRNGLRVDPVDASAEMVRLANQTHDIGARQATFEEIDVEQMYDGVWANFSLLHASTTDFSRYLAALHRALKPAGSFHIGMKLGNGAARDRLGRHYSYYSKDELSALLNDAGFTIVDTTTGKAQGLAGDIEPWITLTCQTSRGPQP